MRALPYRSSPRGLFVAHLLTGNQTLSPCGLAAISCAAIPKARSSFRKM